MYISSRGQSKTCFLAKYEYFDTPDAYHDLRLEKLIRLEPVSNSDNGIITYLCPNIFQNPVREGGLAWDNQCHLGGILGHLWGSWALLGSTRDQARNLSKETRFSIVQPMFSAHETIKMLILLCVVEGEVDYVP